MRKKRSRTGEPNVYIFFTDIALQMLTTFIFLLVMIIITSKVAEQKQIPELKANKAELEATLQRIEQDNQRLRNNMDEIAVMTTDSQMEKALAAANLTGNNRKDFDLFIEGLRNLPGDSLHLVVDATGSMHGVSNFLIPILRVIVIRSGKELNAVTWFSDLKAETLTGQMGEMFDSLMNGAPFIGNNETIGHAFTYAAAHAPAPGAYLLIGDEPSSDVIHYLEIPSPVFTLPLGRTNPETEFGYRRLAEQTQGRMLKLELK